MIGFLCFLGLYYLSRRLLIYGSCGSATPISLHPRICFQDYNYHWTINSLTAMGQINYLWAQQWLVRGKRRALWIELASYGHAHHNSRSVSFSADIQINLINQNYRELPHHIKNNALPQDIKPESRIVWIRTLPPCEHTCSYIGWCLNLNTHNTQQNPKQDTLTQTELDPTQVPSHS